MPSTSQGKANWSRRNFAPVLMLSIGGQPANDLLRLCTTFKYKRTLAKASETKFTFRNDDRNLLDDVRLFPNTEWQFRFGYFNDLSSVIVGFIRQIEPVYEQKRIVTVSLFDSALNMIQTSSAKKWGRIPSSDIATAIAKKHGFKVVADPSKDIQAKAFIQPNSVNDLQYLRDLAALIDFEVFVSEGSVPTLYYRKKPYDTMPKAILTYYDDPTQYSYVKKFTPKVKSLGPIASAVTSTDVNKKGTKTETKQAGANLGVNVNAYSQQSTLVNRPKSNVGFAAPANHNTSQLAAAARNQMLDKCNEAHSEHPLTPSIEAGNLFEWAGIEKQINGKWYCNEVEHEITGAGSKTSARWKRNSTGDTGGEKAKNTNTKGAGDKHDAPRVTVTRNGGSTYRPGI